jgi:ribosomal protein L29
MKKQELQLLQHDQLREKVDEVRRELFSLRLNAARTHSKDYSQFNKKRKTIARMLTFMAQKKNAID